MTPRIVALLLIGMACGSVCAPARSRADVVTLRSGGEIRGELQIDNKAKSLPEVIKIRALSGATILVDRNAVDTVVRRRPALEEYETLRRSTPQTLAAQWELAEWCRKKGLSKEREVHLRTVVELEPTHLQARRALGHVRDKKTGEWKSQDELMSERGYVKHKGRYVLPQQLEQLQQDARESEAEKTWFKKVRMWKGWLDGERADRRSEALAQLQTIEDSDAVAALSRTFKESENPERRLLYVKILGNIEGDKPVSPLVLQSLWDESRQVREAAVAGLRARNAAKALPMYLRALRNRENAVVNRAGDALSQLGTEAVVPQLIDALITRHTYTELVPDQPLTMTSTGGSVPAGQSGILPPNIEALLATGQLPYGVRVETPATPVRMKEVTYEKDEQNESVLTALNLISGEDFGYDESAWRRWYNSFKNAATTGKRKPTK
ncbi:MAG: HEAT repeat domain-containing protein [Planctomycetes bacterium]|nr:HEAT repeat domain-containing protein [Planctomycetota bacterium]